jgi:hypothetical protein
MVTAWHSGAFSQVHPIPPLKEILAALDEDEDPPTEAEQNEKDAAAARAWQSAFAAMYAAQEARSG